MSFSVNMKEWVLLWKTGNERGPRVQYLPPGPGGRRPIVYCNYESEKKGENKYLGRWTHKNVHLGFDPWLFSSLPSPACKTGLVHPPSESANASPPGSNWRPKTCPAGLGPSDRGLSLWVLVASRAQRLWTAWFSICLMSVRCSHLPITKTVLRFLFFYF